MQLLDLICRLFYFSSYLFGFIYPHDIESLDQGVFQSRSYIIKSDKPTSLLLEVNQCEQHYIVFEGP